MSELERLLARVDAAREDLIAFHQALVRIPTVNTGIMPTGNETACAEYIQSWLAAHGIESEVIESAPSRGNVIARLKGGSTGPSLLLMTHLDTVPVEDESKWAHAPFSAEIIDGKVWGRGSEDCKGAVATVFFAAMLLKQAGIPLKGDLICTGTADEESGGFFGYGWLADNAPDKIRADFAINEGAGLPLPSKRGWLYGLGIGEKGRMEVTVSISGRSGHASRPWAADNALVKAGRIITAMAAYEPKIDISHPLFGCLGELVDGLRPPTLDTLEDALARVAAVDASTAVQLRALSRMTMTPTILHAGVKSNSIPAAAVLKCDVRTLPWQDAEYVRREVERTVAGIDGVEVDVQVWARSTQSPFDTPFTRLLERSLQMAVGNSGVRVLPTSTVGFTDSQYTRPLGIPTYGFTPLHLGATAARPGVHGINESFEIESLIARTKFYVAAAYSTVVEGVGSPS